jgi:arylsulfatase A-like enzyme
MRGVDLLEESRSNESGVSGHHFGPSYDVTVRTWRTDSHRYTIYGNQDGTAFEELFDLKADPNELTNLACLPAQRELLGVLRSQLLEDIVRRDHDRAEVVEIARRFRSHEGREINHDW